MNLSSQFKFTQVTLDDVFDFIKQGIQNGEFPKFKNYSDEQLLSVAIVSKPIIEAHLTVAGRLALQQLEERKTKADKATLSEVTNPSGHTSQCKA
jgi:hypothetical protein